MTATPDAPSQTNSPAGIVVSDACSVSWAEWPKLTGQQFVHHAGKTWVGSVQQIVREEDVKLIVWNGGSHYVLWGSTYRGGFWFRPIDWPEPPIEPC